MTQQKNLLRQVKSMYYLFNGIKSLLTFLRTEMGQMEFLLFPFFQQLRIIWKNGGGESDSLPL